MIKRKEKQITEEKGKGRREGRQEGRKEERNRREER